MATAQELQAIVREMTNTMKKIVDNQQSFLSTLFESNSNSTAGRRRSSPGDSPTNSLNVNRRLTGSLKNMTAGVDSVASNLHLLARNITVTNRQLNKARRNPGAGTGAGSSSQDSQFGESIRALISEMRVLREGFESGNNNSNNPPPDPQLSAWGKFERAGALFKSVLDSVAVRGGVAQVSHAMSRGSTYSLGQTNVDAITMGMGAEDLLTLQSTFRQEAMRASGGVDQWTASLKKSQSDLLAYSANPLEAALASAEIQSGLMKLGFSFDETASIIGSGQSGLVGQLKGLSATTGMTIRELSSTINSIAQSDVSRDMMRRMTKNQRTDYMLMQTQLFGTYKEITGDVERAKEIMRAQIDRTQKDAKSRYIEAAKTAHAARLSGMSNSDASELQRLLMMNPTIVNQDPELLKRMTELGGKFHANIKDMQGSANFSTEHLSNVLARFGKVAEFKAFDVELDVGSNVAAEKVQRETNLSSQIDGSDFAKSALTLAGQANALLKNILFAIGVNIASNLFTYHKQLKNMIFSPRASARAGLGHIKSAGTRALDYIKGLGGRAAPFVGPPLPPGGGLGGRAALMRNVGSVLKGGLIAGIVTTGAGYLIDKLYKPATMNQERGKNASISALGMAGLGATIGSFIAPVIGTAIGAALGGIVGAIYGLTKDVKSQAEYDINQASKELQVMQWNNKFQHEKKLSVLQTEYDNTRELYTQASGNEKMLLAEKMQGIRTSMDNERTLFAKRSASMDVIHNLQKTALDAIYNKAMHESALDDAMERSWYGKKQFDTKEYMEGTGMSNQDLYEDIRGMVELTEDQATRLGSVLADPDSNGQIRDADLLEKMKEYDRAKRKSVTDEATKIVETANTESKNALGDKALPIAAPVLIAPEYDRIPKVSTGGMYGAVQYGGVPVTLNAASSADVVSQVPTNISLDVPNRKTLSSVLDMSGEGVKRGNTSVNNTSSVVGEVTTIVSDMDSKLLPSLQLMLAEMKQQNQQQKERWTMEDNQKITESNSNEFRNNASLARYSPSRSSFVASNR